MTALTAAGRPRTPKTPGRKPMDGTKRITIVLDEGTRKILEERAGKGKRGDYIRAAILWLMGQLSGGEKIDPVSIVGETSNFPLKAPQRLLEDAEVYWRENGFAGLSEFIRTGVARYSAFIQAAVNADSL